MCHLKEDLNMVRAQALTGCSIWGEISLDRSIGCKRARDMLWPAALLIVTALEGGEDGEVDDGSEGEGGGGR